MREQYLQVIISHGLIQAALWKSIAYSYRQYWYAPAMVIRAHSIWHDNVDEAHYNHSGHSLTCQSALGGADVAEIHMSARSTNPQVAYKVKVVLESLGRATREMEIKGMKGKLIWLRISLKSDHILAPLLLISRITHTLQPFPRGT